MESNLHFCDFCCRWKPKKGFIFVEGTGDFKTDVPTYYCFDCKDSVVDGIKQLPWKPTYKITYPWGM